MPLKVKIQLGLNSFEAEGEFDFDVDFWTTLAMWLEAIHEPDDSLPDSAAVKLDQIIAQISNVHTQGANIMSDISDLRAELAAANTTTNEIAADVDELVARAANATDPAEIAAAKADAAALTARLRAVAAKYPVPPPVPPAA